MSLYDVKDLSCHRGEKRRLMSLDLGEKTIGIAVSDPTWQIATPLTVIRRTNKKADIAAIFKLANDHNVIGLIVGFPVNMNGTFGPQATKMQDFAEMLSQASNLLVALWDERLSTVAVNRTLLEADMSRKRRAEVVDKLAAAFILQGALDRLRQAGDR